MSKYSYNTGIGGPSFNFGMPLEGEFGNQMGLSQVQGFNTPTGSVQAAWLVAQNSAGNLGFRTDDPLVWDSGIVNMPRLTDHLLPSFPAKGDSDAQLSTQPSASQPGQSMSNQQDDSADSDPALTKQIGRESSERVSAEQGKELGARVRKPTGHSTKRGGSIDRNHEGGRWFAGVDKSRNGVSGRQNRKQRLVGVCSCLD